MKSKLSCVVLGLSVLVGGSALGADHNMNVISGASAKGLYQALTIEAKRVEDSSGMTADMVKKGKEFACSQSLTFDDIYECNFQGWVSIIERFKSMSIRGTDPTMADDLGKSVYDSLGVQANKVKDNEYSEMWEKRVGKFSVSKLVAKKSDNIPTSYLLTYDLQ